MRPACTLIPLALLLASTVLAQPQPGEGYALRAIDGIDDVGRHYALADRSFVRTGFFHLEAEGILVAANCYDGSCSGANAVSDPARRRGSHVSAVVRTALNDRPLVAYYDETEGDLVLADCQGSECLFSIERVLDSAGDVGQFTAIALDPATGFGLIAYRDASAGALKLYRCGSATCDSGSPVVVDAVGDRGRSARILHAAGRLWIAYEDLGTGSLLLASGSAPYTSFGVMDLGPGAEPALLASGDDFPLLLWRDPGDDSLAYMRCLDADCAASDSAALADPGEGFRPSAVVDGSGLWFAHASAAGELLLGHCSSQDCVSPSRFSLASGADPQAPLQLRLGFSGDPVVYYRNAARRELRTANCTADCAGVSPFVVFNGLPVGNVRLALSSDGSANLAYIRMRQPWFARCSDATCGSFSRRALPFFNSDTRPALAVRPDDRAFGYFASVGGSAAYDCDDADCSSGQTRTVSGSGNSTSNVIEMALRPDGRPVLLYTVSSQNDVYLFLCADAGCSSGSSRLLADEPTTGPTFLGPYAVGVGSSDRPFAIYGRSSGGSTDLMFVRCDDADCSGASSRSLGPRQNAHALPLAVRGDGRPVFIDHNFASYQLAVCSDADCSEVERHPLPPSGFVRSLKLSGGLLPEWDATVGGIGRHFRCLDPLCADVEQRLLLQDASPGASYIGTLDLGPDGAAVAAFEDGPRGDVWLAVPFEEKVFADGFE
jgi:hypothetical protein